MVATERSLPGGGPDDYPSSTVTPAPEATIRLATPADAPELHRVIHAAFAARLPVDPPADALSDSVDDVAAAVAGGYGVVAELAGELVAGLLIQIDGDVATLRRVSVLPSDSGRGLARDLVASALLLAAEVGCRDAELLTRREFPELVRWWQGHGFDIVREVEQGFILARSLPVVIDAPTADAMRDLGRRLAALLVPGDVIIATGDLGAGKTTLAQGIGAGLAVSGPIISPTFVISRVHPATAQGPDFVHVDAYRMGDAAELADIDLDASLARSVTFIEWGQGKAEWLSDERLEIAIERGTATDDDGRTLVLTGTGARWADVLDSLREAAR